MGGRLQRWNFEWSGFNEPPRDATASLFQRCLSTDVSGPQVSRPNLPVLGLPDDQAKDLDKESEQTRYSKPLQNHSAMRTNTSVPPQVCTLYCIAICDTSAFQCTTSSGAARASSLGCRSEMLLDAAEEVCLLAAHLHTRRQDAETLTLSLH